MGSVSVRSESDERGDVHVGVERFLRERRRDDGHSAEAADHGRGFGRRAGLRTAQSSRRKAGRRTRCRPSQFDR